jgi:predicted alpha/beta hydrolase family esterase
MATVSLVYMAGIGNSEPAHWQSVWAASNPGSVWVEPPSWELPVRDEWVAALKRDLLRVSGPSVIVAHSLGCLAVAEAASDLPGLGVLGAFLVAVPDTRGPKFPICATGFTHATQHTLPIQSVLVTSSDDPYSSFEHSETVAKRWHSRLVPIGARGHVNLASNLGEWAEGQRILSDFIASL